MRALGTDVRIDAAGAERAAAEILRLEAILTRFRPSPLTRLNRDGFLGRPPRELVAALRHALDIAARTGGLVTPAVLPALEHAGYGRSWPEVTAPRGGDPPEVADWREIRLSEERIELPPGLRLDLGGSAKSWIVEEAARLLDPDFVLDAGGDVLLDRTLPSPVDVEHPLGGEPLQLLLAPGRWGIATSSLCRRAWHGAHHLIDPRSSRPARSRWRQATAVGRSLTEAETITKLVLLEGPLGAPEPAAPVLAFDEAGTAWLRTGGEWLPHDPDDLVPAG